MLTVTLYNTGKFPKGEGAVSWGIAGPTEKGGARETRKQTSQTSQFCRGPAWSRALKNGFTHVLFLVKPKFPRVQRLSNKEQVRKQIRQEPLPIVASPCTLPGQGLAHSVCPEEASTAPDQGRKLPTQTSPGSVMNVNLNPQRAYSIFQFPMYPSTRGTSPWLPRGVSGSHQPRG